MDFLPLYERSPAHPFSNLVVNLCACTKGHRDHCDKKNRCATFTIAECEGGEICLYDSGLVFDSASGDMLLFQSRRDTHFNLHLKGIRASVVLHSDREGDKWVDNYNRWSSHVH